MKKSLIITVTAAFVLSFFAACSKPTGGDTSEPPVITPPVITPPENNPAPETNPELEAFITSLDENEKNWVEENLDGSYENFMAIISSMAETEDLEEMFENAANCISELYPEMTEEEVSELLTSLFELLFPDDPDINLPDNDDSDDIDLPENQLKNEIWLKKEYNLSDTDIEVLRPIIISHINNKTSDEEAFTYLTSTLEFTMSKASACCDDMIIVFAPDAVFAKYNDQLLESLSADEYELFFIASEEEIETKLKNLFPNISADELDKFFDGAMITMHPMYSDLVADNSPFAFFLEWTEENEITPAKFVRIQEAIESYSEMGDEIINEKAIAQIQRFGKTKEEAEALWNSYLEFVESLRG